MTEKEREEGRRGKGLEFVGRYLDFLLAIQVLHVHVTDKNDVISIPLENN